MKSSLKSYYNPSILNLQKSISLLDKVSTVEASDLSIILKQLGYRSIGLSVPERRRLLDQTWKTIRSKFYSLLDISHYNAYIESMIDNGQHFNPAELIRELELKDICPNRTTYVLFIRKFCLYGDIEGASKIVSFMRKTGVFVDKVVYDYFLHGYSRNADIEKIQEMLKFMSDNGIEPDAESYCQILVALACSLSDPNNLRTWKWFDVYLRKFYESSGVQNVLILDILASLLLHSRELSLVERLISSLVYTKRLYVEAMPLIYRLINNESFKKAFRVIEALRSICPESECLHFSSELLNRLLALDYSPLQVYSVCYQLRATGLFRNSFNHALETARKIYPTPKYDKFVSQLRYLIESRAPRHKFGSRINVIQKTEVKEQVEFSLEEYNREVFQGSLEKALMIREKLPPSQPIVSIESQLVQRLLGAGFLEKATEISYQLFKKNIYILPSSLKHLIGCISENGRVDLLKQVQPYLPQSISSETWLSQSIAQTYINAKLYDELVDKILPNLKPYPFRAILPILKVKPEYEDKILHHLKSLLNPDVGLNNLFINALGQKNWQKAESILRLIRKKSSLYLNPMISIIRETRDIELAEKTIEILSKTDVTSRSLGIIYTAMLDVLVDENRLKDAEDLILSLEQKSPVRIHSQTAKEIPATSIRDINRVSLIRLCNKIYQTESREAKFRLPNGSEITSEFDLSQATN